jgi:hypothetical protein
MGVSVAVTEPPTPAVTVPETEGRESRVKPVRKSKAYGGVAEVLVVVVAVVELVVDVVEAEDELVEAELDVVDVT